MVNSPSKKRSKLTLAKYNDLKKPNKISRLPTTSRNDRSVLHSISSSNTASSRANNSSSVCYYHTKLPNEGIDIRTFRLSSLQVHSYPPTLLTNMSKSTSTTRWTIYPIDFDIDDSIDVSKSSSWCCIPKELMNKNRCVVEDMMVLPKGTAVTLLLPKLGKNHDSFSSLYKAVSIEDEKTYMQFGNSRSVKYYIFTGRVHSNPYEERVSSDAITFSEVTSAFNATRCNGYGVVLILSQITTTQSGHRIQSKNSTYITVRWLDLYLGKKQGIQLWTNTPYLRDYASNFNFSIQSSDDDNKYEEKLTLVLSFIYQEIYGDKLAIMNLIFLLCSQVCSLVEVSDLNILSNKYT